VETWSVCRLGGGEGGRWGVPRDGLTRSGATSGHIERGALDNDSEATEGCKHETILVEYVLNVNGDPSKMQPAGAATAGIISRMIPAEPIRLTTPSG